MKKFNGIMIATICFYLCAMLIIGFILQRQSQDNNREYMVEVNAVTSGMEKQGGFFVPDLHRMKYLRAVSYLNRQDMDKEEKVTQFLSHKNGLACQIEPLIVSGELKGLIRFDYHCDRSNWHKAMLLEGILIVSAIMTLCIMLYLKNKMLKPFLALSNVPYELSKGRLRTELDENKNRFFGKFVWGIAMLRDNLKSSQLQSLKLEREKKMLLLSISHDIKTPLNNIKLYAKALENGLYDTEEKRQKAAEQIENLSNEIEGFVKEIVKTSSEEIVSVKVDCSEFYLKDLVNLVRSYYEPKCRLIMTQLIIEDYENRLLKGNLDSAFEVIENIMENAFKYGDGRRIRISFYEEEYCQLIKVTNTGVAITQEEMPHLFDSFYRGSNVAGKEGNGLGLYICREIMRKMEGEIFAQIEEDGMSFQLVFHL